MIQSTLDSSLASHGPTTSHLRHAWLADFAWVPSALLALSFILDYAVDLPTYDQWEGELPFLMKVAAGDAGISDLTALQLEHRIGFTRVVGLLVAWGSGWNSRVFSCVVWGLMCGLATILCLLNRRTSGESVARRAMTNLVGGSVLFGLAQFDLWINAMMSSWAGIEIMLALGVMTCLSSWSFPRKYVACLVLAVMATFSSSMGMQLWALLPPVMLLDPSKHRRWPHPAWVVGWATAAVIAVGCYFWGYQRPPESPPLHVSLGHFTVFFLAATGSPFAQGTALDPVSVATVAGLAMIVVFLTCCAAAVLFRDVPGFLSRVVPWLSLGAFGLISCLAIALGRAGFPLDVALSSRYITPSALTVYALFAAFPAVLDRFVASSSQSLDERRGTTAPGGTSTTSPPTFIARPPRFTPGARLVLCTVLTTLVIFSHLAFSVRSFASLENERIRHNSAKAAILFSRNLVDKEMLANVWSKKIFPNFIDKLDFMDRQGYLRPKTFTSRRIGDLPRGPSPSVGAGIEGAIEQAAPVGNGGFAFAGWAVSSRHRRPADAVLLTFGDGDDAEVFGIAPVGAPRPDIASALGNGNYQRSGWARVVPRDSLPAWRTKIRAWAFDCSSGAVTELSGAVDWAP